METTSISLCMIVKNEADLLPNLLDYLSAFVGEIIIVDTGSVDNTVQVASQWANEVLYFPLTGDFGAARNYGISFATKPWVLVVDADEWPTLSLLTWLEQGFNPVLDPGVQAISVRRENRIDGVLLDNERGYERHVRFFKKGCLYTQGLHEYVQVPQKSVLMAPQNCLLNHHKSSARQQMQNELYTQIADDAKVRLNLGCGGRIIKDWVNVDIQALPGIDLVHDLNNPLPVDDLIVDDIWADQVIEHFSYHRAGNILGGWVQKLRIGGTITIATPDLKALCSAFADGRVAILRTVQLIYGGQINRHDYHYTAMDWPWMVGQLDHWGCGDIKRLPGQWWNLVAQGTKVRHVEVA